MKQILALVAAGSLLIALAFTIVWGDEGHQMVGRVAAEELPRDVPSFFRDAADQLAYLNPEPDRWRDREERRLDPAMNAHHAAEHFVNFERFPLHVLDAPNRLAYLDSLVLHEASGAGLLPYRILELTQRIRAGFRLWRAEEDAATRRFIEERIINDAGILGHYVADGANPHHTSVHHNGWAEGYPNPRGYTTEPGFHGRFESEYVRENLSIDEIRAAFRAEPRVFPELRPAILEFLLESHAELEHLYRLDQEERFDRNTQGDAHRAFAVDRLRRGVEMLRDLWWTAWVTSGPVAEE